MKKILFSLLALLSVNLAWADEVTVPDVTIIPGQTSYVEIYLSVNSKTIYGGFQLDATLPEKLTCAAVTYEELGPDGDLVEAVGPDGELGKELQEANFQFSRRFVNGDSQHMRYVSFALGAVINRDNVDNMMLMRIPVSADESLSTGTVLQGKISEIILQSPAGSVKFDDITFNVTVTDHIDLFDTATEAPAAAEDVNVVVHRTIKGGEWSTICLPFEMTAEQITKAFGADVKLADFNSYEGTYDDSDNVIALDVKFMDSPITEGIEANYPYLIWVKDDISDFRVDNVTINPDEENAVVEFDNGKTGARRVVFGTFFGTLAAGTVIEADGLFLSNNKFYYSNGSTSIKAFRGYFLFDDVLTDKGAGVKVNYSINDSTTGISNVITSSELGKVYSVDGLYLGNDLKNLGKGIYIINGKKIVK